MPKNVRTTTQLHSFHMLARSCSKFSNSELKDITPNERTKASNVLFTKDRSKTYEHRLTKFGKRNTRQKINRKEKITIVR